MKVISKVVFALFVISIPFSSKATLTLNWSYAGNLAGPIPTVQVNWFVQMYQDVNLDTSLSSVTSFNASDIPVGASANSSDDILLASFTSTIVSAKGNYNFLQNAMSADSIAGDHVYTVLFNSTARATATQAWIIDTTPHVLPASGANTYNPSSVGYGPLTVAAVPEPSSIALIGVGLAAIALRRRFTK